MIQPLFDLANPDHPVHQAFMQLQQQQNQQGDSNGLNVPRESPLQSQKEEQGGGETVRSTTKCNNSVELTKFSFLAQRVEHSEISVSTTNDAAAAVIDGSDVQHGFNKVQ